MRTGRPQSDQLPVINWPRQDRYYILVHSSDPEQEDVVAVLESEEDARKALSAARTATERYLEAMVRYLRAKIRQGADPWKAEAYAVELAKRAVFGSRPVYGAISRLALSTKSVWYVLSWHEDGFRVEEW